MELSRLTVATRRSSRDTTQRTSQVIIIILLRFCCLLLMSGSGLCAVLIRVCLCVSVFWLCTHFMNIHSRRHHHPFGGYAAAAMRGGGFIQILKYWYCLTWYVVCVCVSRLYSLDTGRRIKVSLSCSYLEGEQTKAVQYGFPSRLYRLLEPCY